jgi:cysteine sulfinate desulfinase/cysteine desulfurase-like protein
MGVKREDIDCAIRLSLGYYNTAEQIDYAVSAIKEEVSLLRELFK